MPKFSTRSLERLSTCDERLQRVMNEVIKEYDIIVLEGHRDIERQKQLIASGNSWTMKSRHLSNPSTAVDIAPWPIDWNDIQRFKDMAAVVFRCADRLGIPIEWGGNWGSRKFDGPHFQLPKGA